MKKFAAFFAAALFLVACSQPTTEQNAETAPAETAPVAEEPEATLAYFGDKIESDGAIPAADVMTQVTGSDSVDMKITATVNEVCQMKGCWMTVKVDEENEMRVRFKDYGFFMPMDCQGKEVVFEGKAFTDTTSVETLRHYAEDEGLSQEEIDAITEPEVAVNFLASGVILKE